MRGPRAGKPLGAEGERSEGRLEQETPVLPLADRVALHYAVPAADLLVEPRTDPAGRVDPEVPSKLIVCRAVSGSQQELGGAECATGQADAEAGHHRAGR